MEQPITSYYPLGNKTFLMFIFQKSLAAILLFLLLLVGIFFLAYVPAQYVDMAVNGIFVYGVFVLVVCFATLLAGWLHCSRYGIFIYENDITVKRGFFAVEELGIPYRRIKDVKIERSLSDQMFGLSNIIITMLDAQTGQSGKEEDSNVILPALDKQIALDIQDVILKKSQVEDINVLSAQKVI